MIGPRTSIAARVHLVTLTGGGEPAPDGEGGWTVEGAPLTPPTWYCRIDPASAANLEQMTAGTAVTRATHVLAGPYHPQITTTTQIGFNGRTFFVNGVINPGERNVETIAFCEEQVSP